MISRLLQLLGFSRLASVGAPSIKEIERQLSAAGWHVVSHYVPGIDLIIRRRGQRAVLGTAYLGLHEALLQRAQEAAQEENAEAILVMADEAEPHLIESAEARSVLLAYYGSLDTISDRLIALQRRRRDRYGAAKNRILKDDDKNKPVEQNRQIEGRERIEVYRSQYIRVDLFDRGGDDIVISFGDCDDRPSEIGLVDATMATRQGLSELCIRSLFPNFFPAHDFLRFVAEADFSVLDRYKNRWAWGIMHGAYGALKHSKALKCNRALVISPLFSIDPLDVADPRFNSYFDQPLHFDMGLKDFEIPDETVVLYDPYNDGDASQFEQITNLKSLRTFFVSFAADATRWMFKEPRTMEALFTAYCSDDWVSISHLTTRSRKSLPNREFRIAFALASKRPSTAIKIFRKYGRHRIRDWVSVCFLLAKSGHGAEVLPLLITEADRLPTDISVNVCTAVIALEMGQPEKAIQYVRIGLQNDGMNVTYNWIKQTAEKMMRKDV